jgi:Leucine-rich repeat (LRR) protein
MSKFFFKIFIIALGLFLLGNTNASKAQNVFIPDTAFLMPLLNNPAINTNSDGFIQVSEANAYTGEINVEWNGITDLTGIEAFISITVLNCSNNQISNLNLATNTALTQVICANNQINSLNVNTILSLSYLNCSNNQLSNIDVSANTAAI